MTRDKRIEIESLMRNKRFKDVKDHMYRQFSPREPYPQVPPYLLLQRIWKLR